MEIVGRDMAYVIAIAWSENTFDFSVREGAMDPAGRFTLAMTLFSRYK